MTDDKMTEIVYFLKQNSQTDVKAVWTYLSQVGIFRTSEVDTIRFCKKLVKEELFEYPCWLQNDVIKLIVDESEISTKSEIKNKLQHGGIFCLALTEQLGGSSFQNVRTYVSDGGNGNKQAEGKKMYISNGSIADNIVFLARDEHQKLNLFYTNDMNNIVRRKMFLSDAMGKYDLAEIDFVNANCDCLYPGNNFKATFVLNKAMAIERLFCSITMQAMIKNLLDFFLKSYSAKGELLCDNKYWKFLYAKMKINIKLLDTYLEKLEKLYVDGKAIFPSDAAIAKSYATETLKFILEKTEILLGAQNILRTNILLPYDAYSKAYYNAGGANEIMKEIIGADL